MYFHAWFCSCTRDAARLSKSKKNMSRRQVFFSVLKVEQHPKSKNKSASCMKKSIRYLFYNITHEKTKKYKRHLLIKIGILLWKWFIVDKTYFKMYLRGMVFFVFRNMKIPYHRENFRAWFCFPARFSALEFP